MSMANGDIFTTFNFKVQLAIANASDARVATPLCHAEFSECDGLEMTMEPKVVKEGGNNVRQIQLVGPVSYGNLTLKRGMTDALDLWRWFDLATGNERRGLRASGLIEMCDAAGKAQVRYKLFDCLPIKMKAPAMNAKDGVIAIEEMQIGYSRFQVERT
jgi:phage tail-like protein